MFESDRLLAPKNSCLLWFEASYEVVDNSTLFASHHWINHLFVILRALNASWRACIVYICAEVTSTSVWNCLFWLNVIHLPDLAYCGGYSYNCIKVLIRIQSTARYRSHRNEVTGMWHSTKLGIDPYQDRLPKGIFMSSARLTMFTVITA